MTDSSLFTTLKNLRGNTRGCVYTEPLWGIPFNLYAPYASIYMLALGLTDASIGLITSIGLVFSIFWAAMSGAITDKFGRRYTTLVTDIISWSIPCIIWAVSQNFTYFLVAAILNSLVRVSMTSWGCLLVEDMEPGLLIDVWSWIYIAGLLAAFIAPFGGLLIARFSLVPTMRALYLLAFVLMTAKFLIMNTMVTESKQGVRRIKETRHQSVFTILGEYRGVLGQILHSPVTLLATGMLVVLSIATIVRSTFWSILVTEKLLIPDQDLALFFSVRSIVMLVVFLLVMPRLRHVDIRVLIAVGFIGLLLSQVMLVVIPAQSYLLLLVATIIEAACFPFASALLDTLAAMVVDPKERARIMAIMAVIVLVFTSPFGWIAGQLSQMNRTLPFVLNMVLFAIGAVLTYFISRTPVTGQLAAEESPSLEAANT